VPTIQASIRGIPLSRPRSMKCTPMPSWAFLISMGRTIFTNKRAALRKPAKPAKRHFPRVSRPTLLEYPVAMKSRSSRLPRRSCRSASAPSIAEQPASAATSSGKPVEESVTLRDETVSVERRRQVTAGEAGVPAGAFEEHTVEVHQTAEEPVVTWWTTLLLKPFHGDRPQDPPSQAGRGQTDGRRGRHRHNPSCEIRRAQVEYTQVAIEGAFTIDVHHVVHA
jgi:Domain of unknown function (DUF2382)